MKKTILCILVCASFPVLASTYVIKIPALNVKSNSVDLPLEYSDWSDKGGVFNCGIPTPEANQVNWGQEFEQKASCSQNQERTVTKKVKDPFSGQITIESVITEPGVYKKDVVSSEVGTKNYEVSEELGVWSSLTPVGSPFDCQVIKVGGSVEKETPILNYVSHSGYKFNMEKPCKSNYKRNQTVIGVMADGSRISKPDNVETQIKDISVPEVHNAKVGVYSSGKTRITVDRKDGETRYYNSSVYINGKRVYKSPQVKVYDDLL
ncbi:hypothetical protein LMH73_011705, partial [Vibrio splendidus]